MTTLEKIREEIERLVKLNKCTDGTSFAKGVAAGYADVLSFLDTLQEEEQEDCWLFTIQNDNLRITNTFFEFFPTKKDIQKLCGAEVYAILNVTRLTKEQMNKLLDKE